MAATKKQTKANGTVKGQSAGLFATTERLTVRERASKGVALRGATPREALSELRLSPDRPDPVSILEKQGEHRIAELLPIRYGRMQASPFAFYRGSAAIMAADLSGSARSGLEVQLCGDAHLANFGFYASPERTLVFDINDFDETLPGPWEFDLKRLAASFVIAARHAGHTEKDARAAAKISVAAYQAEMTRLAALPVLDIWYARVDEKVLTEWAAQHGSKMEKRWSDGVKTAKSRTSRQAAAKLTTVIDGKTRFVTSPTLHHPDDDQELLIQQGFLTFGEAFSDDRRWLFDQYHYLDGARKVVGVGSVGTRDFVVLMQGRDEADQIVFQIKQAERSVLELAGGTTIYSNQAQRVVTGQRLIQSSSDIFLSWTRSIFGDDFYLRQMRDWKFSIAIETLPKSLMQSYAHLTGRVLAMAHARGGDPVAISAYIGKSGALVDALGQFAVDYADQSARDYQAFVNAVMEGRIVSQTDV